jgi:hypothetical protein
MGTSQSKRDAPPAAPLVPPWADQDPVPVPPPLAPNPDAPLPADPLSPDVSPYQLAPPAQLQSSLLDVALPRRYAGFRAALGRFAASGDRREARTALGHWARTSTGGSRAGAARMGRATRTGGAALAGIARAGAGLPPVEGALDVRTLAGLAIDTAIDRIVDAFCQPGILDEDLARLAIGEALAAALAGVDTFDPNAVDANAVRVATLTFTTELVFIQIAGDGGRALAAAPSPAVAAQREADLRSLVREVTDVVGTPILVAAGNVLTPSAMSSLVSRLVEVVEAEMSTW